jgi:hypothetical protein
MARHVFFSFNYADIMRVNQVRKAWQFVPGNTSQKVYDRSLWEESKKKGDSAIQRIIDDGMNGASVTCVLIGSDTAGRKWVNYEIVKSHNEGMGLFGVRIHRMNAPSGIPARMGRNPFDDWEFKRGGQSVSFAQEYPVYDWIGDDGFQNFARWVEAAARKAGR